MPSHHHILGYSPRFLSCVLLVRASATLHAGAVINTSCQHGLSWIVMVGQIPGRYGCHCWMYFDSSLQSGEPSVTWRMSTSPSSSPVWKHLHSSARLTGPLKPTRDQIPHSLVRCKTPQSCLISTAQPEEAASSRDSGSPISCLCCKLRGFHTCWLPCSGVAEQRLPGRQGGEKTTICAERTVHTAYKEEGKRCTWLSGQQCASSAAAWAPLRTGGAAVP